MQKCEICPHTISLFVCVHKVTPCQCSLLSYLQEGTWTRTFCGNSSFPEWCRRQREISQKIFSLLSQEQKLWHLAIHKSGTVFQMLIPFLHEDEVCQGTAMVAVVIKFSVAIIHHTTTSDSCSKSLYVAVVPKLSAEGCVITPLHLSNTAAIINPSNHF